jgi:hypothetical protein
MTEIAIEERRDWGDPGEWGRESEEVDRSCFLRERSNENIIEAWSWKLEWVAPSRGETRRNEMGGTNKKDADRFQHRNQFVE